MKTLIAGLVLALVVATAALPAVAQAQEVRLGANCTAVMDAYGPEGICDIPPPPKDPPQLPFTGAEAGLVGGAGILLLLMGVAMRRASRGERTPRE